MEEQKIIKSALRCLELEKHSLSAIEALISGDISQPGLAQSFCKAVHKIFTIKGRVVVTGLGKSGHIGSKIAATMASTGTAAFFVHAAEANHGDLGMISKDDVILALSWSGETAELSGIITHASRFKIPLIALTSGQNSSLSKHADIVLLLPKVKEACSNGLAPTSSTTMQLAMGDALSVALLEQRGFTEEDFKIFHPGGSLGAQLTYVGDIMHKGETLPIVELGTFMPQAMHELSIKHFGCVIINSKDGNLAGIITEGDLARNISRDISKLRVEEVMTNNPKFITSDTLISKAALLIQEHQISALLVLENKKAVGLVHFHDLLHLKII